MLPLAIGWLAACSVQRGWTNTAAMLRAARHGDVTTLRETLSDTERPPVDAALVVAASFNRIDCMGLLVEHGATTLDEALVQAAVRDKPQSIRWLISAERDAPATNLDAAARMASASNSVMAEWVLTSAMRRRDW